MTLQIIERTGDRVKVISEHETFEEVEKVIKVGQSVRNI